MTLKTTGNFGVIPNYIYLYHLDKYLLLPMYPDSVTDSLGSNFASATALSRTAPVFSYINSGPRTIAITLSMHRDMMRDLNKGVSNLKDNVVDFNGDDYVDTLIAHLQSMALPKYNAYSNGSKAIIPPMIAIRFGDDIFIKGVVHGGVNVTYGKPILKNNKYAKVDVTFTVYETEPFDADSVSIEGSFRGITRTFKNGIFKDDFDSGYDGGSNNNEQHSNLSDLSNQRSNLSDLSNQEKSPDTEGTTVNGVALLVAPPPIGVYSSEMFSDVDMGGRI